MRKKIISIILTLSFCVTSYSSVFAYWINSYQNVVYNHTEVRKVKKSEATTNKIASIILAGIPSGVAGYLTGGLASGVAGTVARYITNKAVATYPVGAKITSNTQIIYERTTDAYIVYYDVATFVYTPRGTEYNRKTDYRRIRKTDSGYLSLVRSYGKLN